MLLQCVVMIVVSGALLATAELRLGPDTNDDVGNREVLQCYERYVHVPRDQDMVVIHNHHAEVPRYIASIRAPHTTLTVNSFHDFGFRDAAQLRHAGIYRKIGLVVMLVDAEGDGRTYRDFVYMLPFHHQYSRVLVVCVAHECGSIIRTMCADIGRAYVIHVAVLAWNDTRVYTYFPYGGGACGTRVQPELLGRCPQLAYDQLYPEKVPKQFGGCAVPIITTVDRPAVIDSRSDSEQPLVAGYEIVLINIIFGRLNLTKRYYGYFSMGSCVVPGSPYYYTDTVSWCVPAVGPRAQWKNVVRVFQAPLWAAVLVFFLLNAFAWWLVGARAASYAECLLGSLLTLLNGSVPLPRRTPLRCVVVSWTVCSLVLVAAYQSQLLSTLLTPVTDEQPISNDRQLLASDVPVNIWAFYVMFNGLPSQREFINHNAKLRGHTSKAPAVLRSALQLKYLAKNYMDARGQPTLYTFPQPTLYAPQCLRFESYDRSRAVLVHRMVRRLMENGLVYKFMRDVDFSRYWAGGERQDEPLTVCHLDFAFFALLLGYGLATLAFLLETVTWRMQHGWW